MARVRELIAERRASQFPERRAAARLLQRFRRQVLKTTLLISAATASVAAGQQEGRYLTALDNAEAQWDAAQLTNYSYTLVRSDPPYGYTTFSIRVRGADCRAISSATVLGRTRDWQPDTCAGHTMTDLFDRVRAHLSRGVARARIEFDPLLGHVKLLDFEPRDALTFHSEWRVEISHFKSRNSRDRR